MTSFDSRGNSTSKWLGDAIRRIEADYLRSADTHLIPLQLPAFAAAGIDLYLKDESTHPTGSLKHRLARSLFLYALCNGWIGEGTTIVEASSGSTAVSEAYFARLLGLPFIAVMPRSTSPEKVAQIAFHGGSCHFVEQAGQVYEAARALAEHSGGHYMDQFTYAERATDWRGNNNIAESMFQQMARERHPVPKWIVVGAGTGGTSATIGRYVRFRCHDTRVCVVDPEGSVFAAYHASGDAALTAPGSRIEGIGRPRVEPSFVRTLVDRMIEVPNLDSIAAMRALSALLGRKVGPSTGTNFIGMLRIAHEMRQAGEQGSILSLLCDAGERYLPSYHDAAWVAQAFGDVGEAQRRVDAALAA
ncbi:Cysteine synthase B [Variovorax sp. SRS16]|uniref:PLP-dependent cysteine synthase family protein n=1 Tax=Variovorax sp. SRS16 TaxID=282217 RepID=UPI001317E7F8|nr:PLP-dependent cysteine synthase family protein [Variovorax sp. SRS16]VTU23268.1 Cysteine synthase B [Variovorax sp. SRS16]